MILYYTILASYSISELIYILCIHTCIYIGKIRAILTCILYNKSISIDLSVLSDGPGTLNNLISFDIREIMETCAYFHFIWCTIVEVCISLVLLYVLLGYSALGGIAVMVLALPLG